MPGPWRRARGEAGQPGEVTLWTRRRSGHTWPGSRLRGIFARLLLGRTSSEIDATEQIRTFAERNIADP